MSYSVHESKLIFGSSSWAVIPWIRVIARIRHQGFFFSPLPQQDSEYEQLRDFP